ncbi:MAG: DUF2165 family protein [Pseudomonas sp.]|uniref:DUF2165 family protein n=1 Tax=Pseudomonas abieticivorans TaxID=2931382 RepID=UPI0020C09621|nr:DUF2165 family protein [Pseudomonas sp. PIA16]MDE1164973.1 DUF2165 family protein [Pseudomonas sp.]
MYALTTRDLIRASKLLITLATGLFGILVGIDYLAGLPKVFSLIRQDLLLSVLAEEYPIAYWVTRLTWVPPSAYALVTAAHLLFGALCLVGARQMVRHLDSGASAFHDSKRLSVLGLLIGLLVVGLVLGVNASPWLFQIVARPVSSLGISLRMFDVILVGLVFVSLKNDD